MIDHNQAFDRAFDADSFIAQHVFGARWSELSEDSATGDDYVARFAETLRSWESILSGVPEAWWYVDPEMTVPTDFDCVEAYGLLARCENARFWGTS